MPIVNTSTNHTSTNHTTTNNTGNTHLEEDISVHIFTASAAMVGICLTVIGLLRVISVVDRIETLADDVLSLDAFLFLGSCLLAYWALRTRSTQRRYRTERVADAIFVVALIVMVGVCFIITYALA